MEAGRAFVRTTAQDDIFILSGAVAYTAMLSIFPLLLAVIAVLGLFVEQPQAQAAALDALRPYLPPDALTVIGETLAAVARTRGTAGIVAIVGLLWAATAVAGTLRYALNRVLKVRQPRAFWRRKLVDLALMTAGGLFLSLSILTSAAVQTASAVGPVGTILARILRSPLVAVAGTVVPWLLSAAAFLVVYRFLPNARLSSATLAVGTGAAVVLFEAAKRAFLWYLQTLARYPLVYGPLAGLVVFMVWMYVVATLVLLCAEVMVLREHPREVSAGA